MRKSLFCAGGLAADGGGGARAGRGGAERDLFRNIRGSERTLLGTSELTGGLGRRPRTDSTSPSILTVLLALHPYPFYTVVCAHAIGHCTVCLFLQDLVHSCSCRGRRIVQDMCHVIRRAAACVNCTVPCVTHTLSPARPLALTTCDEVCFLMVNQAKGDQN